MKNLNNSIKVYLDRLNTKVNKYLKSCLTRNSFLFTRYKKTANTTVNIELKCVNLISEFIQFYLIR